MSGSNSELFFSDGTHGTGGTASNSGGFMVPSPEKMMELDGTADENQTHDSLEALALDPADYSTGRETDEELDFPDKDKRPQYICYWGWCGPISKESKRSKPPGVYFHGMTEGTEKKPAVPFDDLVCSPLVMDAIACTDDEHQHFGLMLQFLDMYGRERTWVMPREMLRGSCEELRGQLLSSGVKIFSRPRLTEYLQWREPSKRIIAATATGWADKNRAFVLPHRVIGSDKVFFQSETASTDGAASMAGNFKEWKAEAAELCVGNDVLALSVCVALSGPLLTRVHRQSGGIHWVGDSSTGKTSSLTVGASVWGGKSFVRTWRATANGLEGAATLLNDTVLCLDEINEADPRQIGEIIYSIANGTGKTRASRTGSARKVHRWNLTILSTGERSLKAQMAEGGKQVKAGQEIRLLNIPSARTHGAFDELHQFPDGRTLADHLKTVCLQHYGHAGPAFIEALLKDERDFGANLAEIEKHPAFKAPESQSGRAASAFALFGLAGELAIEWGILPWPKGEALRAGANGYHLWLSERGTGMTENRQILQAVSDFIARHGDGRFSDKDSSHNIIIQNRAGWWTTDKHDGARVYLFNAPGLKEAIGSYEIKRALAALDEAGWIAAHDEGVRSKKTSLSPGQKPRLYWVKPGEVAE